MSYRLTHIHGIGPVHQLLRDRHNIRNTEHLIHVTSDPVERRHIARTTGLPEREIKRWRNFAQLLHIPGVGPGYARLLTEAGIEDLGKLSRADARKLCRRLGEMAEDVGLDRAPSETTVERWIGDARTLISGTAAA